MKALQALKEPRVHRARSGQRHKRSLALAPCQMPLRHQLAHRLAHRRTADAQLPAKIALRLNHVPDLEPSLADVRQNLQFQLVIERHGDVLVQRVVQDARPPSRRTLIFL